MLCKSLVFIVTVFCGNSLGLRINDGIIASATTQQESKVERRSDYSGLIAPLPGSISQYYQPSIQPQTLGQLLSIQPPQHFAHPMIQQNTQVNPFLYLGQGVMLVDPGDIRIQHIKIPASTKSHEKNSQNQERNSYVLYRPSVEDKPEFVDMLPPSETQEPNYYSIKPRKSKKYSKEGASKEKKVKAVDDLKKRLKTEENESIKDEPIVESKRDSETESTNDEIEESVPTSRLAFQIHGHKGPKTYKFGYDTGSGDGKNKRKFHVEEKDENGDVKGRYGYFDEQGKFVVVNYLSTADGGFRVL